MSTWQRDLPASVAAGVAELQKAPITPDAKGFGPLAAHGALNAETLSREQPQLHEGSFSFPLLTLRESALAHNVADMAAYCQAAGILFAPHGKTTMAPQLAARQLAAGAWAITVATVGQLRTHYRFGFRRLLLANELVDPAEIAWLAGVLRKDETFEAYCYVDSLEGVALLDAALSEHDAGRRIPVLVELGFPGGRTGARTREQALQVAEAAAATRTLRVAGVAGYEGAIGHHADPQTLDAVQQYCIQIRQLSDELRVAGCCDDDRQQIVSAGGSAFFDVVVAALSTATENGLAPLVVLRSGAYITHDHGFYAEISPAGRHTAGSLTLRPALELWAPVLSRPEPGLALLGIGRRDVSFDEGLPSPLRIRRRDGVETDASVATVTALNDQHAYLQVPDDVRIGPGDLVCLGISHPCTTFDKWRVVAVVDDQERVVDAVHTFF